MTIIATEGQFARFNALVKFLDTPNKPDLFKDLVTANEAATPTYTLGTVMGKITASGKWIVSKQAAADGSQVPAGIYIGNSFGAVADTVMAATTDTKVLLLVRGKAIVALEALKLDASFGTGAQKQFAYDSLKAQGILVEASN